LTWLLKNQTSLLISGLIYAAWTEGRDDPRFEVNYHLFSPETYYRLRPKVLLSEDDPHVPDPLSRRFGKPRIGHERESRYVWRNLHDNLDLRCIRRRFRRTRLRKIAQPRGFEPHSRLKFRCCRNAYTKKTASFVADCL